MVLTVATAAGAGATSGFRNPRLRAKTATRALATFLGAKGYWAVLSTTGRTGKCRPATINRPAHRVGNG